MPEVTIDLWESVEKAMAERPVGQLTIRNWGTDDKPCYQIEAISIEHGSSREQPKTEVVYQEGEKPADFTQASESPTRKATWTRPSSRQSSHAGSHGVTTTQTEKTSVGRSASRQILLRSVEPVSMPDIPRQEAMDFLRHFGDETFDFPTQPGCVLLGSLDNKYPQHSSASGWLLSLTGDQFAAILGQVTDTEELKPYILGTLHFEVGGELEGPAVYVNTMVEIMEGNATALKIIEGLATAIRLMEIEREEEAYDYLKTFAQIYPDAANAREHLSAILIEPSDRRPGVELLEREGFLVATGKNVYDLTTLGLWSAYCMLGHLHYRRGVYSQAAWCYSQAYQMDRTKTEALKYQAQCYMELKDWEFARTHLERLLQQEPDNLDAHLQLCMVNFGESETNQSEETRQKAHQSHQEMLNVCRRVLKREPGNELALKILDEDRKMERR